MSRLADLGFGELPALSVAQIEEPRRLQKPAFFQRFDQVASDVGGPNDVAGDTRQQRLQIEVGVLPVKQRQRLGQHRRNDDHRIAVAVGIPHEQTRLLMRG